MAIVAAAPASPRQGIDTTAACRTGNAAGPRLHCASARMDLIRRDAGTQIRIISRSALFATWTGNNGRLYRRPSHTAPAASNVAARRLPAWPRHATTTVTSDHGERDALLHRLLPAHRGGYIWLPQRSFARRRSSSRPISTPDALRLSFTASALLLAPSVPQRLQAGAVASPSPPPTHTRAHSSLLSPLLPCDSPRCW